jgi:hypothetical protein
MTNNLTLEYLYETPEDDIYFRIMTGTANIIKVKTGKNASTEIRLYYT